MLYIFDLVRVPSLGDSCYFDVASPEIISSTHGKVASIELGIVTVSHALDIGNPYVAHENHMSVPLCCVKNVGSSFHIDDDPDCAFESLLDAIGVRVNSLNCSLTSSRTC